MPRTLQFSRGYKCDFKKARPYEVDEKLFIPKVRFCNMDKNKHQKFPPSFLSAVRAKKNTDNSQS